MLLDSGQTYERSAIEDWLSQGNTRDPVSGREAAPPFCEPILDL